jgi:hypothetical protein
MIVLCVAAVVGLAFGSVANAELLEAKFPTIISGGLSYDASGDNVVVSTSAFSQAIKNDHYYLGTGSSDGNFAFYARCTYDDTTQNAFGYASTHPNTPLNLEIRTHGVKFDINGDGLSDFTESLTFDIVTNVGFPVTFAEVGAHGYTDLTSYVNTYYEEHGYTARVNGAWFDIALGGDVPTGQVAFSFVVDGYTYPGLGDVEATVVPGDLWGATSTLQPSGARINPVPEPCTLAVWSLFGGIGVAGGWLRRRKTA